MLSIIIIIFISVYIGILFLKKNKDFNIEYIIKHGTLQNKEALIGEVFYKGSANDCYGNISYLTYVRLNNGKDIIINKEEIYRKFNFCDKITFSKYLYVHKYSKVVFYLIELKEFDKIRLYTEIETID